MDFDLGASFLTNYASLGGIKILVFRDLECVACSGQRIAMRDKILLARVLRHYAFRKGTK